MARGMPKSKSANAVAPLTAKRLSNVPLIRIGAFRSEAEKESKEGEKYEVIQVKLSLDFDTGHPQRNDEGELVLDDDGREQAHYINEGFITLSGHEKAKFVAILKALGLNSPEFINTSGRNKGSLTEEAIQSLEAEFGTNGLGDDYSGSDWDDLPIYTLPSRGGKLKKREVEVPVHSLKILGVEILGRWLDMALTIDDGWNRVSAYMESEEAAPLEESAPKPAARRTSKKGTANGVPRSKTMEEEHDPFAKDPPEPPAPPARPKEKGNRFVHDKLMAAEVPFSRFAPVARHVISLYMPEDGSAPEMPKFATIHDMSVEACRMFRDVVALHGDEIITSALEHLDQPPFNTKEEEDDEDF